MLYIAKTQINTFDSSQDAVTVALLLVNDDEISCISMTCSDVVSVFINH